MAKKKSSKPHKFVLVEADNWVGLYVDGKCVEQHHDIDLVEWLHKYGVDIRAKYAYNEPCLVGGDAWSVPGVLPESLKDIEFDPKES
jgi:hypothetical protein